MYLYVAMLFSLLYLCVIVFIFWLNSLLIIVHVYCDIVSLYITGRDIFFINDEPKTSEVSNLMQNGAELLGGVYMYILS